MEEVERRLLQNKYEIVSKIKQGGFGVVYYGFDRVFDKPVAIKAIEPGLLNKAKYVDLFLEEAKSAAKLSHNNIVHIYDLVKNAEGQFFIIMEFIEGYDLGRILRQCQKKQIILALDLNIYIIKEVCKALEYAHNKRNPITNKPLKLVHQDISPSNLMISLTGQVKLIDFGLAKIRLQKTRSDQILLSGKLPYMAPEQINGGVIDRRTDIFSLGVIFYEMLIGSRLIEADDPNEAIQKIKKLKIDSAILEKKNVPQPIQAVLLKMLNKNPNERYYGANGVYLDLVEFLMSSSHSVDLSDELGAYIQELYKIEDLIDGANIEPSVEAPIESHNLNTESPGESSIKMGKEPLFNLESNSKTLEKENQSLDPKAKEKSEPISVSSSDKTETVTKTDQIVELDEILSEMEQNFTRDKYVQQPSSTDRSIKEQDIKQKTVQPKISEKLKKQLPPQASNTFPEEDEDDLKTVIDVIRLSTRSHQKGLKIALIAILACLILFAAFDFKQQITPFGEALHNQIFPPAIKITSVPSEASVYLNGKRIPGKTPISIPKITPGVYQLSLTHAGFNPIAKSIQVPAKGKIKITGAENSKHQQSFLFRFKSRVELNSNPTGAIVYLNNIEYPQKTPISIDWDAGAPLSIEMEHAGFNQIAGLTLNTLDGSINIDDDHVWSHEIFDGMVKKYSFEGNFKKIITLNIIPSDVTWFIDGSSTPSGNTKVSNSLALSVGEHELLFKKQGFNDKLITTKVNENGPKEISLILDRNVHFSAHENAAEDSSEINANITKFVKNNKSFPVNKVTPCDAALPAVDVLVYLEKDGYEKSGVTVTAEQTNIQVSMKISAVTFEVFVHDALTNLPLNNTNITYQAKNDNQAEQILFGTSDENGRCVSSIKSGEYNFKADRSGYFSKQLVINTQSEKRKMEFKLIIQ